jgi:hypothetical protein
MEVPRGDQKMDSGNRGYLKGTPPPAEDRTGLKRPFLAVDVDVPSMPVNEGSITQKTAASSSEKEVVKEAVKGTIKETVSKTVVAASPEMSVAVVKEKVTVVEEDDDIK